MEILNSEALLEAWRTSNEPIGHYIINEDFDPSTLPDKMDIQKDTRTGKPLARAIFQSGGVRNRNGRIYMTEDLDREIHANRTQELLRTKNLFCEAGHPIDTSLQRQSTIDWRNSNCKILTLEMNGNNVEGIFTPSNTQLGKAFAEYLLEGVIPAFSLTRVGAQVADLRLITYDQVIYPSHSNAYMTELLGESASIFKSEPIKEASILLYDGVNRIIPMEELKEAGAIQDFINNNSNNIRYINSYFGAKLESVKITPSGTKVILAEDNSKNKIEVAIEKYVHNELMNYASSIKDAYHI